MVGVPAYRSFRKFTVSVCAPVAKLPFTVIVSSWPEPCSADAVSVAADLLAVDADRVLRAALECVLADLQHQGIRTAADRRAASAAAGWRAASIGEGEIPRTAGQQRRRAVGHRDGIVGDAVHVQVAIGIGVPSYRSLRKLTVSRAARAQSCPGW